MKDNILEILKNSNKALTVEEIDDRLNIKSIEETKEFLSLLNELEEEGEVYHSNKNKYMIFNNGPLKKGIIRMNKKGFGFVEVEGSEDIFISIDNINNAIHNDVVVVEVLKRKEDGRLEGRIVRTIKRDLSTVVGEIIFNKGVCNVIPDDKKLKIELVIDTDGENLGLVDGHKVIVKIDRLISKGKYMCSLDKIIGHKNDPGVDILSIVYNYEIKDTFDEETIAELDNIPEEVLDEEKVGRRDLTNEVIFTIDGDDTKDIDDAISIEKLENGHYKLGVHIADVSYYVKEGSAIDNEAMLRGTSVYLVDRVIPMLPHKLSNGICSLNPNVERLAMSCVMEFDDTGKQVDYEIFQSVINSKIQMTYKKVNSILEDNVVPEGYEPYEESLRLMAELAKILRKYKVKRGYIDFGVDEAKILVDEDCKPTEVILRDRGVGENLIEDFMIIANVIDSYQSNLYMKPDSLEIVMGENGYEILEKKVHGAWMGRVCGCMLGKTVEGIRTNELIPFLKESGNYPMHRYIYRSDVTAETCAKYKFAFAKRCYADEIDGMPVDDDTNYVVLAQEIIRKYGREFTPYDVSRAWMRYQPKDEYWTAERVAFCNFIKGYAPPESAVYQNPYREWIGAQIRGDYFGYINPGNPEKAAEMETGLRSLCGKKGNKV